MWRKASRPALGSICGGSAAAYGYLRECTGLVFSTGEKLVDLMYVGIFKYGIPVFLALSAQAQILLCH
jgi:hypothetical protein